MKKHFFCLILLALLVALLPTAALADDSTLTLGTPAFDTEWKFTSATGTGTDTYGYLVIYLGESMGGSDSVTPPGTASGNTYTDTINSVTYIADAANPYAIKVTVNPEQTASAIAENYLRKIKFVSAGRQTVRVDLMEAAPPYSVFYSSDNDHYYCFIDFPYDGDGKATEKTKNWLEAYAAAQAMEFNSRSGYLATITLLAEDLFVYRASGQKVGWLGGTTLKPATEGEEGSLYNTYTAPANYADGHVDHWYWACGPERGEEFFDVTKVADQADYERNKTENNYYFNWHYFNKEPNNAYDTEDCLTTLAQDRGYNTEDITTTTYSWNDKAYNVTTSAGAKLKNGWNPEGYLVEFGDKTIGDSHDNTLVTGKGLINCYNIETAVEGGEGRGSVAVFVDGKEILIPTADEADEIQLEARPNAGYRFKEWVDVNNNVSDSISGHTTDNPLTVTMPAADISLKAVLEAVYGITNNTPQSKVGDNNGYIEIDKEVAAANEKVTVTVVPNDGYRLRSLTVTDANGKRTLVTGNSFTMPAKAVTVTAVFEEIPENEDKESRADTYRVKVDESTDGGLMVNTDRAEAGEIVRITVTPDKGFALETLTVRDRKGNEIEIRDMGNGWFTFVMPKSDVTVYGSFMEDNEMLNFCVDVKASDYYYDAVLWAYEQGVAKGIDSTHFGPNRVVTRAEAVTLLWRAAGCPAPTGDASQFTDVKKGSYYAKAVAWGIEKGVVKGTSKTTFSPHMLCSRAHIVSFLARFAGVEDAETVTRFTDVQPSDYFSAAVKWAEDNGVTEGTTSTTFSPHKNCTRAEVVTFIYRWLAK